MTTTKSTLPICFGAMTLGEEGKPQARVHDLKDAEAILDVFQKHGHTEVDTARVYCGGTSEEYLGKIGWQERGLIMETKLYPNANASSIFPVISHSRADVRKHFEASLKALKADKIEMFYLHGPDRKTPFEETLAAIDELYKEGKFKRFGISNYYSWEVAEMCTLCRQNGWIQPTAYQGVYNLIHRAVERELFPCLRKFGISFYLFNPLGGGMLTGRYTSTSTEVESGARFDPNTQQGSMYRARYWNEKTFQALDVIDKAAKSAGLSMGEVALRWVSHHSEMSREKGDTVIIGASSTKHLETNLADLEKGPLPKEVLEACDNAWQLVCGSQVKYWH